MAAAENMEFPFSHPLGPPLRGGAGTAAFCGCDASLHICGTVDDRRSRCRGVPRSGSASDVRERASEPEEE